jgi:hypothetical protein
MERPTDSKKPAGAGLHSGCKGTTNKGKPMFLALILAIVFEYVKLNNKKQVKL